MSAARSPRADPTREGAFHLLTEVLDRGRSLDRALDELGRIAARDRAAAHRIAAAVLRHQGSLDAALEPFLRRAPPDSARHVLRIGAASLLFLSVPPHAAVATAVSLARSRGLAPFAPLVNAVLRRLAEKGADALADLDQPRLDTPAWLWQSWGENARAIAEANAREAPLDLTLKPGVRPPAGGVILPNGSVRFPPGTLVTDLPGFAEGEFWVQDAAAAMPPKLLAPRPGERVLDLCAAPGGKTAALLAAGASVVALERDPARLERLTANLERLHLSCETVLADATSWRSREPFPAILLDAPCSASGTIRRHPDILRLRHPRDLAELTPLQDRLIENAARLLTPGGRLLYAVCSLEQAEGPARIAAALSRLPLTLDPFTAEELAAMPEAAGADGTFRTHPGLWSERGGMDGFFAARLLAR